MNLNPENSTGLYPETRAEVQALLAQNARDSKRPLMPVGGATSARIPAGVTPLSTRHLTRVIDYPHRDLTITVEAGLSLAELRRVLAEQGQRLPIDAALPERVTLGGLLASNTSGPGRFGYGTLRDDVIGISAVDGMGRAFSAGGRVVKNVAGYDLCKLLIGSRGALAVITQITFRLRPLPASQRFICAAMNSVPDLTATLDMLNTSQTRPVVMEVVRSFSSNWRSELRDHAATVPNANSDATFILCLAFEGTAAETSWQVQTVRQELQSHAPASIEEFEGTDAAALWSDLTEAPSRRPGLSVQIAFAPSQTAAVLESLPASAPLQWHAGDGVATCLFPDGPQADQLDAVRSCRSRLAELGSRLWVDDAPPDWSLADRLALEPGTLELHRRIKAALDPGNFLYSDWLEG